MPILLSYTFLSESSACFSGFFPQQKQNIAEKDCSKTGPLDLKWSKDLLRSLSLEFNFFSLRDLVLFKGQSPKICLQRFSPGLSVSHFHPRKGQRQLPTLHLLCSPPLEHLIHREISCPGLEATISSVMEREERERALGLAPAFNDPEWGRTAANAAAFELRVPTGLRGKTLHSMDGRGRLAHHKLQMESFLDH